MGTRGAFGFRVDDTDRVVYNHYDSYPSGLGRDMLQYVAEQNIIHGDNLIPALSGQARGMIKLEPDQKPTPEQIKELEPFTDLSVNGGRTDTFYTLLRKTQGDPNLMLEARYYTPADTFLREGLFCEYAYIINLDKGVLEFYSGFFQPSEVKAGSGDLGRYWPDQNAAEEYGPVVHHADIPLAGIRADTIDQHVEQMDASVEKAREVILGEEPDEDDDD
ncbi:MAG: hypothetical protein EOP83_25630 [Verrucomicrobiaceae bacterium]|nr:MAG: hypothetical protein EOP83_25630 [Verrucomicrobiaceae bacterium]